MAVSLAAACSSSGSGDPLFGSGGTLGATGGTGSAGAGAGGSAATGGSGTSAGGSTGTPNGDADCSSVSGSGLPINASGWVGSSCGTPGIQGAWYCYDDGQPSTCTSGSTPFQAGTGMCLSGTSIIDTTYTAWGGGIGLSLNESGGNSSVKSAYDATANGVLGFRITLEGDSLGQSIRVGFSGAREPGDLPSPFVEVGELTPGTPVTAEILIADALVPLAWELENSGEGADPTSIFDLQVQFPGAEVAGEYSFCIKSIEPITDGSVPTVTCDVSGLTQYGSTSDEYGTINAGSYMVQNDVWNPLNGATQSITAYQGPGANSVAFRVQPNINVSSLEPASYPSAVYGWHFGSFHGGYTTARQISAISSAPSVYEYCAPSSGRYNVAYDLWIHPQTNPPNPDGGTELMIWIGTRDATPIGSEVGTATLAGATWEVWYGDDAWDTLSYRRITNTPSVDFDLMEFIRDGVSRGYYQSSEYLLSVQTGFEIWEGNEPFTAQRISTSIN